ncbi:hypothetical protein TWF730_009963 [Orbilia blumenaviensis]|uniref:Uncharacterized protein n=1 Tax=Orbilia blumenaviensis TaxID=1796055 RepID=A0AAV9UTF1_9PEZI
MAYGVPSRSFKEFKNQVSAIVKAVADIDEVSEKSGLPSDQNKRQMWDEHRQSCCECYAILGHPKELTVGRRRYTLQELARAANEIPEAYRNLPENQGWRYSVPRPVIEEEWKAQLERQKPGGWSRIPDFLHIMFKNYGEQEIGPIQSNPFFSLKNEPKPLTPLRPADFELSYRRHDAPPDHAQHGNYDNEPPLFGRQQHRPFHDPAENNPFGFADNSPAPPLPYRPQPRPAPVEPGVELRGPLGLTRPGIHPMELGNRPPRNSAELSNPHLLREQRAPLGEPDNNPYLPVDDPDYPGEMADPEDPIFEMDIYEPPPRRPPQFQGVGGRRVDIMNEEEDDRRNLRQMGVPREHFDGRRGPFGGGGGGSWSGFHRRKLKKRDSSLESNLKGSQEAGGQMPPFGHVLQVKG